MSLMEFEYSENEVIVDGSLNRKFSSETSPPAIECTIVSDYYYNGESIPSMLSLREHEVYLLCNETEEFVLPYSSIKNICVAPEDNCLILGFVDGTESDAEDNESMPVLFLYFKDKNAEIFSMELRGYRYHHYLSSSVSFLNKAIDLMNSNDAEGAENALNEAISADHLSGCPLTLKILWLLYMNRFSEAAGLLKDNATELFLFAWDFSLPLVLLLSGNNKFSRCFGTLQVDDECYENTVFLNSAMESIACMVYGEKEKAVDIFVKIIFPWLVEMSSIKGVSSVVDIIEILVLQADETCCGCFNEILLPYLLEIGNRLQQNGDDNLVQRLRGLEKSIRYISGSNSYAFSELIEESRSLSIPGWMYVLQEDFTLLLDCSRQYSPETRPVVIWTSDVSKVFNWRLFCENMLPLNELYIFIGQLKNSEQEQDLAELFEKVVQNKGLYYFDTEYFMFFTMIAAEYLIRNNRKKEALSLLDEAGRFCIADFGLVMKPFLRYGKEIIMFYHAWAYRSPDLVRASLKNVPHGKPLLWLHQLAWDVLCEMESSVSIMSSEDVMPVLTECRELSGLYRNLWQEREGKPSIDKSLVSLQGLLDEKLHYAKLAQEAKDKQERQLKAKSLWERFSNSMKSVQNKVKKDKQLEATGIVTLMSAGTNRELENFAKKLFFENIPCMMPKMPFLLPYEIIKSENPKIESFDFGGNVCERFLVDDFWLTMVEDRIQEDYRRSIEEFLFKFSDMAESASVICEKVVLSNSFSCFAEDVLFRMLPDYTWKKEERIAASDWPYLALAAESSINVVFVPYDNDAITTISEISLLLNDACTFFIIAVRPGVNMDYESIKHEIISGAGLTSDRVYILESGLFDNEFSEDKSFWNLINIIGDELVNQKIDGIVAGTCEDIFLLSEKILEDGFLESSSSVVQGGEIIACESGSDNKEDDFAQSMLNILNSKIAENESVMVDKLFNLYNITVSSFRSRINRLDSPLRLLEDSKLEAQEEIREAIRGIVDIRKTSLCNIIDIVERELNDYVSRLCQDDVLLGKLKQLNIEGAFAKCCEESMVKFENKLGAGTGGLICNSVLVPVSMAASQTADDDSQMETSIEFMRKNIFLAFEHGMKDLWETLAGMIEDDFSSDQDGSFATKLKQSVFDVLAVCNEELKQIYQKISEDITAKETVFRKKEEDSFRLAELSSSIAAWWNDLRDIKKDKQVLECIIE